MQSINISENSGVYGKRPRDQYFRDQAFSLPLKCKQAESGKIWQSAISLDSCTSFWFALKTSFVKDE